MTLYQYKAVVTRVVAFVLLATGATAQTVTLHHAYYDLTYDTVAKHPVYGHYFFTARNMAHKVEAGAFTFDRSLPTRYQHGAAAYNKLPYDKGHIVPADDFLFDTVAARQVMVYTNVAPEYPALNRGVWKAIENYVRSRAIMPVHVYSKVGGKWSWRTSYVPTGDTVEVWTGVMYGKDNFIPYSFWKVVKYWSGVLDPVHTDAFGVFNTKQKSNSIKDARILLSTLQSTTGLTF